MKPISDTLQLLRRSDVRMQVDGGYLIPLLPLLEHSHSTISAELRAFHPDLDQSPPELLRQLVLCALELSSDYWAALAVGWLSDGFPLDAAICNVATSLPPSISQRTRHSAFRIAKQWERQQDTPGTA